MKCLKGPRVELIAIEANLVRKLNGPRLRFHRGIPILMSLAICWPATCAWPQQQSASGLDMASDASFSSAPEARQAPAQQAPSQFSGSVHGTVVDREGTVYEGVRVQLADTVSLGQSPREATTDSYGSFVFTGLPPGPFELTISSKGFATQVISGSLNLGQSYDVQPVVLLVDTAVSQVRVTASQQEIALAQFKQEEKQRVFGVIPNYFVTYAPHPAPLSTKQKFDLAWKSSIDPVTFVVAGAFAGIEQAAGSFSGYGQGAPGYAKRFGAVYADSFISTMMGGAIFPALLKQDPRYFYKGTGSTRSRVLYAISMSVMCKGDNGRWQVNYSGIIGGLAAGGVSNLYYPASNRDGAALTFENALIGVAGSAVQNIFQEFFVRKLTPKIPNYELSKP